MKKIMFLSAFLLVLAFANGGMASADYNSNDDINVNVEVPFVSVDPELGAKTTEASYEAQENLHEVLKQSGYESEYYYIWISINGVQVLAVDPPKPMF